MTRWSALHIKILLHYYANCDDFERMPIWPTVVNELRDAGLMTPEGARPPQTWTLTDRGRCFIEEGVLNTQLPIWTIPR